MTEFDTSAPRPTASGPSPIHRLALALPVLTAGIFAVTPAFAHVKWFAPYIVGAPPQPVVETVTNAWFWHGIVLVLMFFLAIRYFEKRAAGAAVLNGLDRISNPLWTRLTTSSAASSGPSSSLSLPSAASTSRRT